MATKSTLLGLDEDVERERAERQKVINDRARRAADAAGQRALRRALDGSKATTELLVGTS